MEKIGSEPTEAHAVLAAEAALGLEKCVARRAQLLARQVNRMIAKHGGQVGRAVSGHIKTGCVWNPHNQGFQVWLPTAFAALIRDIERRFLEAGLDVSRADCEAIGAEGFTQVDGNVR